MSWLSGNTLVSTLWSDGYLDAPDMPSPNWFAPCPHCKEPVWLADCDNLGEDDRPTPDPWGDPEAYAAAKQPWVSLPQFSMRTITHQDIERGILKAHGNTARQTDLRILFMHRANDADRVFLRDGKPGPVFCPAAAREANLLALIALLQESQSNDVLLAEAYRELGEFSDAIIVLFVVKSEESWAATQISDWASADDRSVHILKTPGST